MIGQEGSEAQLNKYTVNKPPPTQSQINMSLQPISTGINNFINSIKNIFQKLEIGAQKIIWILIVLFVVYILASFNKK